MTVTDENRHSRAHVDLVLIALVFGLSLFGIVAVCVATFSPGSDADASFLNHIFNSSYAARQCLFLLVSPLVVGVIMAIPYEMLRQRAETLYWISFVLLTVTTIFNRAQGVKAWLDILWGYTIQPSEFAKLSMILILAKNLSKQERPLSDFRSLVRVFLMVIIPGLVILLQGETGSLIVIIFLFAVMMFFSNVSLKTLGILAAILKTSIMELPFPIPFCEICSPSHITKAAPAVSATDTEIIFSASYFASKPSLPKPTAMPMPSTSARPTAA